MPPIMLALRFMFLVTYYASNYANIIGLGISVTAMFLPSTPKEMDRL